MRPGKLENEETRSRWGTNIRIIQNYLQTYFLYALAAKQSTLVICRTPLYTERGPLSCPWALLQPSLLLLWWTLVVPYSLLSWSKKGITISECSFIYYISIHVVQYFTKKEVVSPGTIHKIFPKSGCGLYGSYIQKLKVPVSGMKATNLKKTWNVQIEAPK